MSGLIARLIAAGTPPELIEEVALLYARAQADRDAIEARRTRDRDRQSARRHVTSRDIADVVDSPPALNKETSPRPPKEINPTPRVRTAPALPERVTGQRGQRIDIDWQPGKPLPDAIGKVVAGWPPGRLDEEIAEFRDFWLADAGQRASKMDWDRTWWNRLRAIIKHDQRHERGGQRGNGNRNHNGRPSGWAPRPGMEGSEPAYLDDP
ncbi:hypothetical protein BH10PSE14_BH10PSE14_06540 [soil metagenome]